jgi:hypothetical protein
MAYIIRLRLKPHKFPFEEYFKTITNNLEPRLHLSIHVSWINLYLFNQSWALKLESTMKCLDFSTKLRIVLMRGKIPFIYSSTDQISTYKSKSENKKSTNNLQMIMLKISLEPNLHFHQHVLDGRGAILLLKPTCINNNQLHFSNKTTNKKNIKYEEGKITSILTNSKIHK